MSLPVATVVLSLALYALAGLGVALRTAKPTTERRAQIGGGGAGGAFLRQLFQL